jgi:hypothetical protein
VVIVGDLNPRMPQEEITFKAHVVWLLLNGRTEEALEQLAGYYDVRTPAIRVGLPKGHRKGILACYTAKNLTINALNSDILMNPFVILHEFYHHLRTNLSGTHKGTERNADEFARNYIKSYNLAAVLGSLLEKR